MLLRYQYQFYHFFPLFLVQSDYLTKQFQPNKRQKTIKVGEVYITLLALKSCISGN